MNVEPVISLPFTVDIFISTTDTCELLSTVVKMKTGHFSLSLGSVRVMVVYSMSETNECIFVSLTTETVEVVLSRLLRFVIATSENIPFKFKRLT